MHEVENGNPCAFLIPDGCAIHNGKPLQCRSYPFWHENMTSKSMWKLVEGFCPGVGVGPAATVATIRQFLAKFKL
jgi:Fe-S-cluster containining protein